MPFSEKRFPSILCLYGLAVQIKGDIGIIRLVVFRLMPLWRRKFRKKADTTCLMGVVAKGVH